MAIAIHVIVRWHGIQNEIHKSKKMKNLFIFVLGVLFFLLFLSMPALSLETNISIINSLRHAAATFYGRPPTDLAQDIIGFRAMVKDENAYPNLAVAHGQLGLDFPVNAKSTHLPTTFLFVAPVAFMTWRYASASWAFLMLFGIICTFRILGFTWLRAIGYGFLSIMWLPIMASFGQLNILWLLFVALAYKLRHTNPLASGLFIGIASLIKLFPAVLMIPFLLQKKWHAMYGFLLAGGAGLASVLLISHQAIYDYMGLQQNVESIILRSDNSSLFNVGYQYFGVPGILTVIVLLGIFLLLNRNKLGLGEKIIQEPSWMVWTFLSVALLPVVWIYSLVPLLPVVVKFMKSKDILVKGIGWASIIMPIWGHPWGNESVPLVAGLTLLIGTGITIDHSPSVDNTQ
jgi:hypothetical protein